jgi:hypothetical protein
MNPGISRTSPAQGMLISKNYWFLLFLFAGENRYDGHSGLPDAAIARLSQGLVREISAGKSSLTRGPLRC